MTTEKNVIEFFNQFAYMSTDFILGYKVDYSKFIGKIVRYISRYLITKNQNKLVKNQLETIFENLKSIKDKKAVTIERFEEMIRNLKEMEIYCHICEKYQVIPYEEYEHQTKIQEKFKDKYYTCFDCQEKVLRMKENELI